MLTSTFGNAFFPWRSIRQRGFDSLNHLVEARSQRRGIGRSAGSFLSARARRRGRIQPVYRLIQPLKRLAQPVRNIRQFAFPATSTAMQTMKQ